MTSVRQRKIKKNPKFKASRKVAKAKKKITFGGHHFLKQEWNVNTSFGENYRKMGLIAKLNGNQRGSINKFWLNVPSYANLNPESAVAQSEEEKDIDTLATEDNEFDEIDAILQSSSKNSKDYMYSDEQLDNMSKTELKKLIPKGFALIQRDSSGKVKNVVMGNEDQTNEQNQLGSINEDQTNELPKVEPKTEIAARLEQFAENAPKRERWCSDGQLCFAQEMINKHGLDYQAMFWDTKLNVNQHTAKQIERKVKIFLKSLGH
ncbi:hypothetical protein BB561_001339 [Smittium simulii]|uniref:Nucleolar protein 16 n=1 Tax=Smittium simulii TaxID=133385 RepID=A0A2T9YV78_9FUNG|nr:hypothetical protein BB561_001339 [Smittium simulii]